MRRILLILMVAILIFCFIGCGKEEKSGSMQQENLMAEGADTQTVEPDGGSVSSGNANDQEEENQVEENTFYITATGKTFVAIFAENDGAQALKELLTAGPLTIPMRDYGGFEKVGAVGRSLPTSNTRTTAQAGDIVLYQGNQIVIFYGSNSWSYTRLGKVGDLTGWADALGNGDLTVTFSLTHP